MIDSTKLLYAEEKQIKLGAIKLGCNQSLIPAVASLSQETKEVERSTAIIMGSDEL